MFKRTIFRYRRQWRLHWTPIIRSSNITFTTGAPSPSRLVTWISDNFSLLSPFAQTHTHTHTHTHPFSHTHTLRHINILSHTHTHTHTLSLSRRHRGWKYFTPTAMAIIWVILGYSSRLLPAYFISSRWTQIKHYNVLCFSAYSILLVENCPLY